jgi:curved DNA-binding protein CbpA
MKSNVDPYRVLDIKNRNFTMDELKDAYRKIALQVHPDKGGTEYMFNMVTSCYKTLVKEYQRRVSDKQYHELKTSFQQHEQRPTIVPNQESRHGFNIDKFNRVFEENKLNNGVEKGGYGDFLKATPAQDEPDNIFKGEKKVGADYFNKVFEEKTTYVPSSHIVKYKEPEPLLTTKKIGFTELGVEDLDDYSADNTSKKSLNFMDVKIAHTTSRIVDPRTVDKRKDYRSVEDLENDRSRISYHMSDKERTLYEKKQLLEKLREEKRKEALMKSDQQAIEQFDKLHRLMLGR